MTPTILFKFATRSRPIKFLDGLKNITSRIADKENYKILVTADSDDASMNNELILNSAKPYTDTGKVKIVFGTSTSKIDAINRDMENENDWHILINYSDDMEFIVDGFDNIIRQHFRGIFPDFNGNVYYNDGFVGSKLSTMSIIGKAYFDTVLQKKIYHPEYVSLFCDNEYTEVAKKLNKIQYYDMILYRHNHPANTGIGMDEQYVRTEGFWQRDSAVYERRKSINFGINF
jgi:hypothetical protein